MASKKGKTHDLAQTIIDGLKDGTAPFIKPWTPDQSQIPHNPVSGTRYKGINILHLAFQNKPDPRWITFKQAQSKGWQVKRGTKGTVVQYWQFEKDKAELNTTTGEVEKKKVKLERPILRHYYVFNGSDIEGIPELKQENSEQKQWDRQERAENIIKNSGADIEHKRGDTAAYSSALDMIVMPERDQFDSSDKYYAIALHELGHWTGHESRLDRKLGNVFGSEDYAREELRAEIASFITGMELEVGHDPQQHLAYVDSWISILEDHPTEIYKACGDAERINSFIMDFERDKEQEQSQETIMDKEHKITENSGVALNNNTVSSETSLPDPEKGKPENQGQQFISYISDLKQDSGIISLELSDKQPPGKQGQQVVKLKNAIELDISERNKVNLLDLSRAGVDGVILTDKGKTVAAITTDPKTIFKGMFQATRGEEKIYLTVPFEEKNQAKTMGALWDGAAKSWYITKGINRYQFDQWKGSKVITENPQHQFGDFIRSQGGDLQGELPIMDGKMHRIPEMDGKKGNKDVAYVGHLDGVPAGWVKNHRQQSEEKWKLAGVTLSQSDRERIVKEGQEKQAQREKERNELYEKKSQESVAEVNKLQDATGKEEYFKAKGIEIDNPGVKVNSSGSIVIPLQDVDGKHWSHQTLNKNGFKSILKDSRLQGAFAIVGAESLDKIKGDILIAEGYSTAASVHEATKQPVIVSVTSGNLGHVAKAINQKHPDKGIIIMADDDKYLTMEKNELTGKNKENTGLVTAKQAAYSVNGAIITPVFEPGKAASKDRTDFNDMARFRGKEMVKEHMAAKMALAKEKIKVKQAKEKAKEQENQKGKEVLRKEEALER